ncbi:MAG: hypothetical protein QGI63_09315 [Rhodospirillales bacterium]|nr:hypothetical protein [Rhodospirillales bacterium]
MTGFFAAHGFPGLFAAHGFLGFLAAHGFAARRSAAIAMLGAARPPTAKLTATSSEAAVSVDFFRFGSFIGHSNRDGFRPEVYLPVLQ